jgi:hypothetical protein
MIIQGDNIIVNGNAVNGANMAKIEDVVSVDVNNRVLTTDLVATQSFRIGDDAHWKIRPNNGNQELCFEYGTSNVMSDANIKARFNSSGHLLNPNQPSFYAYQGSVGSTTTSGTFLFTNTRTNVGNCYSTANGRFTAPVSGNYMFIGHGLHRGQNTASNVEITFFKNGTNINSRGLAYSVNSSSGGHTPMMTSALIPLVVGDYVQFGAAAIASGSDIYLADNLSHFTGFLIG